MEFSSEALQLFNRLKEEMLADGFEKISEFSFSKRLENITVSLVDNAVNIAYKGKSYGLIPEQEFLQLQQSVKPMLHNIRYLLLYSMQEEMDYLFDFLHRICIN